MCRIVEEEQDGRERAKYGSKLLKSLSSELTGEYGSGFSKRNLEYARKVYLAFPDFQIMQKRLRNLTWSHLCIIALAQMECRRYLNPRIFIETSHINYDIINLGRLLSLYNFTKFLAFSIFPIIPSVAGAT